MASYITSAASTAASYLPSLPFVSSKATRPSLTPSSTSGTPAPVDLDPQDLTTIFKPETCSKKGLHWVDGKAGEGHSMYYEL